MPSVNGESERFRDNNVPPARVLLIDSDPAFAAAIRLVMARRSLAQVWLWHERTPELALTLLQVCDFDLILFTIPSAAGAAVRLVHAIAETAIGRPLLLLRHGNVQWRELDSMPPGVVGITSKDDIDLVGQAIAQALGYPAQAVASAEAAVTLTACPE